MARALHINLGDQTAKKLDELSVVLEENKTALVSRLIREEWERERAKVAPIVQTGSVMHRIAATGDVDPAEVSRELAFQVARGAEGGRR